MSDSKKQTPDVKTMKETIEKIKIVIYNLDKKGITNTKEKEDYFWKNHGDIMAKYPFLVSMMCSGGDMSMLDMMMYKLTQIQKGELSHDEADKEIGKQLADDYLPDEQ